VNIVEPGGVVERNLLNVNNWSGSLSGFSRECLMAEKFAAEAAPTGVAQTVRNGKQTKISA